MPKKPAKPTTITLFVKNTITETQAIVATVFGTKRAQVIMDGKTLEFTEQSPENPLADAFFIEGNADYALQIMQARLTENQIEQEKLKEKLAALTDDGFNIEVCIRLIRQLPPVTQDEGVENE